ncbi:uncharacterized protein LOC107621067 [Arachis ipaensis]|uniref:uncharacterized protein LOC107621067 n=1 Tax=Arachis ipaensis TaxID=130454 RepID=UPI0007AF6F8D|nr:uncharacterized protein LOC107621067 [Arachis ipaensis]
MALVALAARTRHRFPSSDGELDRRQLGAAAVTESASFVSRASLASVNLSVSVAIPFSFELNGSETSGGGGNAWQQRGRTAGSGGSDAQRAVSLFPLFLPSRLPSFSDSDNDKKNILAVQSLRNTIMGSTLMATTSILLSSGLAAVISSTYSIKKPLDDALYGGHGEFMVALKYVTLLIFFLFSFFCHSLSIRFINQVNILINTPQDEMSLVTPDYVNEILEKGFVLNTVGNRIFYAALPLLLWIFGPVLVFLCSITMIPVLYNLDFVVNSGKGKLNNNHGTRDFA